MAFVRNDQIEGMDRDVELARRHRRPRRLAEGDARFLAEEVDAHPLNGGHVDKRVTELRDLSAVSSA